MSCVAALHLNISIANSDDDLTPFGIILYNWERATPASPVILRGRRAMVVDQVSCVIILLTGNCSLSAFNTCRAHLSVHENDPMFPLAARGPEQG
eukprot:7347941-Pyramimonas_sp.AAC.1